MRISASKAALLERCGYSFRDDAPQDPDRPSPAAERGVRIHSALEEYVRDGVIPAEGEDADIVKNVAEWLKQHDGSAQLVEVAFGYDHATDKAKVLEVEGRNYPKDLLCGRADLVLVETRTIVDWKSGSADHAGAQLRTLGLMAARAYGWDTVTVLALEVRQSEVQERCRQTLDAFDLDVVAGELAERLAAVPTAEPTPGSWCSDLYCNSRIGCPLGNEATAELIPADALVKGKRFSLADPIATPEQAAMALDIMRLVSAKLDAIKAEIKAKVPADGWRLEDGRILKESHSRIEYVDKDAAFSLAKKLGATDEQLESCRRSFERGNGLRVSGGATRKRTKAA